MRKENMDKSFIKRIFLLAAVFLIGIAVIITDIFIGISATEDILLKIIAVIVMSCTAYYLPVLIKGINKNSEIYKKRQELRFLKKIFVMSGSIKPVDYMQVVNAMYERSFYYRQDLENIMDVLRKNNIDKEDFFGDLLLRTDDIDSKLFYEKLSIGFLYDFDLAVRSIEADFVQEKRAYARFIKKRINFIHIIGVTGLFVAMAILLLYMLQPWLNSMNLQLS
ncbi:MAG: hypothetical protein ACLSVG_06955 [Clostridia bacterium]